LATNCSGEQAVDNDVYGDSEPYIAVVGDHLRGVGGDQREPVGRFPSRLSTRPKTASAVGGSARVIAAIPG